MNVDYRIRPARMAEADRIERLQARSLLRLGTPYYGRMAIESYLRLVGTLDVQLIEDRTYYVAEADGNLIGCGGWTFRAATVPGQGPAPAPRLDPGRDAAFIRAVYVSPEFARCGVGSALIKRAEDAAARGGFVRSQLVAALSGEPLYRKLGYRESGRLNISLPDGTVLPGLRMARSLPAVAPGAITARASEPLEMLPHVA